MTHISTSFIFKYALGYVKIPHLGGGPVVDTGMGGPGMANGLRSALGFAQNLLGAELWRMKD